MKKQNRFKCIRKNWLKFIGLYVLLICSFSSYGQNGALPVFKSERFQIYSDRVVQGNFEGRAISSTEIVSNYRSPANQYQRPEIIFKFSINSKDNEMISGRDHHFNCISSGDLCETPLIEFGQQFIDLRPIPAETWLKANTKFKIKADLRKVFQQFKEQGFYQTFNNEKIYKDDFKGIWVAGNLSPLTWDFNSLVNRPYLQMKDDDGDHIYEITLLLNEYDQKKSNDSHWKLSADVSAYPQYSSDYPLVDALYNMSLEEMMRAVEKDSTFRTGKEWAGVWTRDISYSIILSMAILQPKVAVHSLMRKVKNGIIIQDTGTGGAYPVSTDRIIWAVAAWEIYKVTGNQTWLKQAYHIVKKSIEQDSKNIIDPITGLVKGESSFLDWREQTYPRWMQPADIYESECLGTNAVHYQANVVLAKMADALHDDATSAIYTVAADKIKQGVNNNLWLKGKNYYGQFLYGRNYNSISPKSEALGEALCILFDISDEARRKEVTSHTPVNAFGIPCLYPQIPNIPPYHNNATWPFVQSYWALAGAKAGNEASVLHSLSCIYRPGALFLTNKENFVVSNGDYLGTQINSDNMLWSLSGNIGVTYKVLFGIHFGENELILAPFIPQALKGHRRLTNFKYRNAVLDFDMEGFGNKIKSITLDGKVLKIASIPSSLTGKHLIKINLDNNEVGGNINLMKDYTSPETPQTELNKDVITWSSVMNGLQYKIIKNGNPLQVVKDTSYIIKSNTYGEYQIITIDREGFESFASEPIIYVPNGQTIIYEIESAVTPANYSYKGFSGKGFVETNLSINTSISFSVTVPQDGLYAVDFRYANGNGPVNTANKCAIRNLSYNNGQQAGTIVFPQRGVDQWSDWGYSNSLQLKLKKGSNSFILSYEPENVNMNGEVNQAMIDFVRLIKIE